MTVSRTDIQELIAEVDQLLWATDEAEPDLLIEPTQYQAVLEKVRWCLSNLARQVEVPNLEASPLGPPEQQTANAIAQAVMAQMNLQRQDWLQPMQLELETVRQQRETLRREIQHLETQQRQMSHELLQTVMHRCSEALKQELTTVFDRLQGQFNPHPLSQSANPAIAGTPTPTNAPPALQQLDWLEKLRSLEQQADQLFLSLDQTFHQVFHSLEQDVQSYHQSLRHKLGQIHELQNQTFLAPGIHAGSLPQAAAMPPNGINPELGWQAPPGAEMPLLQLDRGEPLPALEPLMTGEITGEFVEPMEQVLQLDLHPDTLRSDGPATTSQPHTVSSDQAWEAWDEYLFTHDPGQDVPLSVPDLPRVLTVNPPQSTTPPPLTPNVATSSSTVRDVPLELPDLEPAADLPREVQQELFANLGDPATVGQLQPIENSVISPDVPLSAGTALFGDPVIDPEAAAIAADDLAAALDANPETETDDPQGPSLEETIASLDELLEQVSARMAENPVAEAASDADSEQGEDKISPGETLLATAEVAAQPSGKLDAVLDDQKMDQLAADLASFETEAPAQAASERTDGAAIDLDTSELDTSERDASERDASESETSALPTTTSVIAAPVSAPNSAPTQAEMTPEPEPTPVSTAPAGVEPEATLEATVEPMLGVESSARSATTSTSVLTPMPTPQAEATPQPESGSEDASVVAAETELETVVESVVQDIAELPDLTTLPTQTDVIQTDAVTIAPPDPATVEMSETSSDETASNPSDATTASAAAELPAPVVLTSLSELDWTEVAEETAPTDDAEGDLWGGQQRSQLRNTTGQNS